MSSKHRRRSEKYVDSLSKTTAFNKVVPRRLEKHVLSFLCPGSLGVMLVTNKAQRSLVHDSLHSRRELVISDVDGNVSRDELRLWVALLESSGNLTSLVVRGTPGIVDGQPADNPLCEDDTMQLLEAIVRANCTTLESVTIGQSRALVTTESVQHMLSESLCQLLSTECPQLCRFLCSALLLPVTVRATESIVCQGSPLAVPRPLLADRMESTLCVCVVRW